MKKTVVWSLLFVLTSLPGCVIRGEHRVVPDAVPKFEHIRAQAEIMLDFVEGGTDALPAEQESVPSLPVEIAERMRARHPEITTLKEQGCLGEMNCGLVELRDCDAIEDAETQNAAQKIVAEENKDRKALYTEVVRLNRELPDINVATVQFIYFLARLNRGAAGALFEMPEPGPAFDTVKTSVAGEKLGAQCTPSSWVALP